MTDEFDTLVGEATESLAGLGEHLGDVDSLETLEDETLEKVLGNLDTLGRVATALEDILETIDVSKLPDAIDGDEAMEGINLEKIPDALGDDGDLGDVVDVKILFEALELLELWDATEFGNLWEGARELSESVDDLAEDDESLAGKAASAVTDEDGLGDGELLDGEMDLDVTEALGIEDINVLEDPELYQTAIQQGAMKGIDGVRDALLIAHEKFEDLYEFNRERMRRTDRGTNSRNPTAVSTMPLDREDLGGSARYSTVPQDVRLSTAPSRRRIYGRRFEIERERRNLSNGGDRNGR